jgi:hypothetical protein
MVAPGDSHFPVGFYYLPTGEFLSSKTSQTLVQGCRFYLVGLPKVSNVSLRDIEFSLMTPNLLRRSRAFKRDKWPEISLKRSANFESRPQSRGSGKMSSAIMQKVCDDDVSGCVKLYWKVEGPKANSSLDLAPDWGLSRVVRRVPVPSADNVVGAEGQPSQMEEQDSDALTPMPDMLGDRRVENADSAAVDPITTSQPVQDSSISVVSQKAAEDDDSIEALQKRLQGVKEEREGLAKMDKLSKLEEELERRIALKMAGKSS